jgi:glycine/D-amino acid oxidase-like deaminating enzyme
MRAFVAPRIPDLPATFLAAMTSMYTNTPDEHFVIARHPSHEQVVGACGFSGHGFKFVPVVGEIIADLITDGGTSHPIGPFDPRRLTRPPRERSRAEPNGGPIEPMSPAAARSGAELIQARGQEAALHGVAGQ